MLTNDTCEVQHLLHVNDAHSEVFGTEPKLNLCSFKTFEDYKRSR